MRSVRYGGARMEAAICCNFSCSDRPVGSRPHGRAVSSSPAGALVRMRPPGRGLLPAVLRLPGPHGHGALAGGRRPLHRDDPRARRWTWSSPRPGCATTPAPSSTTSWRSPRASRASAARRSPRPSRSCALSDGTLLTESELRHVFVDPDRLRQAGDARARTRRTGGASRPHPPDGPPAHRRPVEPRREGRRAALRCCRGHQRGAPPGGGPQAGGRPDPLRRRARGRQPGHRRPEGPRHPRGGLDRGRADRQLDLRRGPRRRACRARAAVGRGGLGGGRGTNVRADRAVRSPSSRS